jgi:hypothetical protein
MNLRPLGYEQDDARLQCLWCQIVSPLPGGSHWLLWASLAVSPVSGCLVSKSVSRCGR